MNGSCLCGAVRWATDATPDAALICHCTQCRKQSGHAFAATRVPANRLTITGEVRWFHASPTARRGFCPVCGSFLFWQPTPEGAPGDHISIGLGSVDGPTDVGLHRHIHCATKGDYFAIPPDEPQQPGWS